MRISAGRFKGRRLMTGKPDPTLRPISGRMRKSLFDILRPRLAGARFLDLFAGTGAVGLEAASQGAAFIFFVEKNPRNLELITRNIRAAGLEGQARGWRGNALDDLSWVPFRSGIETFDLVFMAPPYSDEAKRALAYTSPALRRVASAGLLAPGGWVICQHHGKEPVAAPPGLEIFRREKYGDSAITFLRGVTSQHLTNSVNLSDVGM